MVKGQSKQRMMVFRFFHQKKAFPRLYFLSRNDFHVDFAFFRIRKMADIWANFFMLENKELNSKMADVFSFPLE